MAASAPPLPPMIFAPGRRLAARRRMMRLAPRPDAPRYLMDDMGEDVLDRLSFLRVAPRHALVIGDWTGALAAALAGQGAAVETAEPAQGFDEERPFPATGYDFIASLGTLDTVNDLPGALIHLRGALAPGGLMIASFLAAGSLPALRAAMLAADGDRPSPRIHPQVDVRAGGQLLQRAGFADPVIDSRSLDVSFRSFAGLVADVRAQALSNVLVRSGPPLGKAALARAQAAFAAAGQDGRTVERFEILTLSGWRR
ncbi:MAG: methyltransferase domain-containing protein [Novosphingobium sp.]|jgi:SAM-dependent methyltransferase|nr:methyltransferase domain-containing protein [Novosphingobium sp.]